ncbi:hypothetical protein CHARACLAT_032372 [Characodon lateralis]|uniref:Uncharacterized protein n=1 Tax=Characodon lateralis TaxID=208331 RepID=A0ABU7D350_9TELE|nr:hypothetical protein [Characodon lateralis]
MDFILKDTYIQKVIRAVFGLDMEEHLGTSCSTNCKPLRPTDIVPSEDAAKEIFHLFSVILTFVNLVLCHTCSLICQSVIFYRFFHSGSQGSWCLSLAVYEGGGRVHPGQVTSPSQGNTQTTMHTLIHTPKGNLERLINLTGISLDCGRKPEYPVRTHACTGRTCKVHAERIKPRTFLQQGTVQFNLYLLYLIGDGVKAVNKPKYCKESTCVCRCVEGVTENITQTQSLYNITSNNPKKNDATNYFCKFV